LGSYSFTPPKKVATGLNFVDFANVVFYEPDNSIYTMMQAMRRVWRPGQTKPVKVRFLVYEGTMEARALSLVAAKAVAATWVVGDDAEVALASITSPKTHSRR
jgi:SNF2 family DNA or RNA helicase